MENNCLCIECSKTRRSDPNDPFGLSTPFRFACEICGNKRCPHHTDHRLECTNSNEPGQKGSIYENEGSEEMTDLEKMRLAEKLYNVVYPQRDFGTAGTSRRLKWFDLVDEIKEVLDEV